MKKLSVLIIAPVLALALAVPAFGYQVKVGAEIVSNFFYSIHSNSGYVGAAGTTDIRQPGLTGFTAEVNGDSTITFEFTSDDKSTGAAIVLNLASGPPAGANAVGIDHLYGWYKFGRCKLVIGHTDNLFATDENSPYAGLATGFGLGAGDHFKGFGKMYGGRMAQIAFYYETGPLTFNVALGMPQINVNNDVLGNNNPSVGNNQPYQAYTVYPRLDLALAYAGKHFWVAPGVSIYQFKWEGWEGAPNLEDNSAWAYAIALPFKLAFGNFQVVGEVGYGLNWLAPALPNTWRNAVWWGGRNDVGLLKAADTHTYSACLGLSYKLGRVTLWLSGGWQKSSNGSSDAGGTWRHGQNTRMAFALAVPYEVNGHFTIAPEVSYYYYGWDPRQDVGGSGNPAAQTSTTADQGSMWLIGIQFVFSF